MSEIRTIQPQELARLVTTDKVEVIDVRTPAEFREVHATCARNIPLDRLDPKSLIQERSASPEKPLYVICKSGSRGQKACQQILAAGFENVINVEGGTSAWEAAGLPVERGKKTISLERQVRIAAGAIVFAGAVLGAFVHPGFIGLCAFVGAGLMFAGITDWCGMAMVLARAPWNQVGHTTTCSVK